MDSIWSFIDAELDRAGVVNLDELIDHYAIFSGIDWILGKENPWDYVDVSEPEFEMRSALEFVRSDLTPHQLERLAFWDGKYRMWRDDGILYSRYKDAVAAGGNRHFWRDERAWASEWLGRSIPRDHWWFWPPDGDD